MSTREARLVVAVGSVALVAYLACIYWFSTSDRIQNIDTSSGSSSTVVTSWFPLQKSKHSLEDYYTWIQLFIGRIEAPLVIFTTPSEASRLKEIRHGLPVQIVTVFTPWTVPPLRGVKEEYTHHQNSIDPERAMHGPELYAVWNSKAWFLAEVSRKNPFRTKYFFWVDIGSFRSEHSLHSWPDPGRLRAVFSTKTDAVLLGSVSKYPNASYLQSVSEDDEGFHDFDRIQGTFFGGSATAVQWWEWSFYKVHSSDLARGRFVGKDQTLMNKVAALGYKNTLIVDAADQCGCGGQSWFYFQPFLANRSEVAPTCVPKDPLHFI